jgi:Uri superfamily endonuclease
VIPAPSYCGYEMVVNEQVQGRSGHYILVCQLDSPRAIRVGRLGDLHFANGFYAYVGSALAGLHHRLHRHLGPATSKPRWHIDYLLAYARPLGAVWGEAKRGKECPLADLIAEGFASVSGFGSTDCRCAGHLFYSRSLRDLWVAGGHAFRMLGRKPRYLVDPPDDMSGAGLRG